MTRRLFAALAGCLALPALGWAQSDGFTIPNAPIYPGVRPAKPVDLAPTRPASPYNVIPMTPTGPGEPKPIVYPSQQIPSAPSLGVPQPMHSTSFKNPQEVRLDLPQESKVPVLAFPEPKTTATFIPEATPVPVMNPTIGAPTVQPTPATPAPQTAPPPSRTYPTSTPPGTWAESIIRTPTSAALNGCQTCAPTGCGPYGRAWVGAEYLYFTARGQHVPPLISTSPAGTPIANAGVLGTPGAATVFGDSYLNNQFRSGVRIYAGYWFDSSQTFGIQAGGFFLGRDRTDFTVSSTGSPILSRPFVNAQTGTGAAQLVAFGGSPAAELVSFPGVLSGRVSVGSGSSVYGFDPAFLCNLCCSCDYRIDLIFGYRYLRLSDGLTIREDLVATDPAGTRAPFGTQIAVLDSFNTTNTFNGGTVGLQGEKRFGNFFLGGRLAISAGNTHQEININGTTQIVAPDGTKTNLVGGLLAQQTNIGNYRHDSFSVVPELGLNAGYQVSRNVRVFAGYNFLYWTNVARAGEQIDIGVNPSGIPRAVPPSTLTGPARPAFIRQQNDYWLHGVSAGMEFRF